MDKFRIEVATCLADALYHAREGDLFEAGVAWERARIASWRIHDGTVHARSQQLVWAVAQALR